MAIDGGGEVGGDKGGCGHSGDLEKVGDSRIECEVRSVLGGI